MTTLALLSAMFIMSVIPVTHAKEPEFKSELFKKGTLVYSDDFDGAYSKERWGGNRGDKQIKDGKLIVSALYKNAEEAKRALKRDHHLGLDPVAHLGKIPEKFVCHMRYKFEAEKLAPNRPVLQIGHHMISLTYLEGGGHKVMLPGGPSYKEPKSGMKINEWVDLVIEYEAGKILLSVNGTSKTYEHKNVTMINNKDKHGPRFTFKHGIQGPNSRLVFDYVRLWKVELGNLSPATQETPNTALLSQKPRLAKSVEKQLESHLALPYASYGDRVMKLDLYRPRSTSRNLPAMVCIHGGGWIKGKRNNYTVFAKSVALKGFVAVTIDYRLSGEATFPAAIHDCKAAVRWLRANATKYGLNPDKIGAIGSSAGGHLAALLGTSAGVPELEGTGGNADQSSAIQVALPWAAQTDLTVERIRLKSEATTGKQLYRNFLGGSYTTHPAQYELASPIKYLDKQDPPFHFICGELDDPSTRADAFRKKLDAIGIPSKLDVIDGGPHGFSQRQDWFTEALDRATTFAHTHLAKEACDKNKVPCILWGTGTNGIEKHPDGKGPKEVMTEFHLKCCGLDKVEAAVVTAEVEPPTIQAGKTHYLYPKSGKLLPYIFSTPKQFKSPGEKIPLVVFLHGLGERGSSLQKVEKHGLPKLIKKGRDFPFAVISPQCPDDGPLRGSKEKGTQFWSHYPTVDKVKDIIDFELKRHPQLDPDRIYVTGLSMGGFGAYRLALKYPYLFAAVIPIAGHANTPIKSMDLKPLKSLPFWAFHGEKDKTIKLPDHQKTVDTLKKAGVDITFTVYPGVGHNSWDKTYKDPKLYEWMLSKRRKQ